MRCAQLIYTSTPEADLEINEVRAIVDLARISNKKKSITGFLCGNKKFFIQCLEGNQDVIKALFEKIRLDKRHHSVTLLKSTECEERTFGQWDMGVALELDKHANILKKYERGGLFNPYALDPQSSLQLLVDFSLIKH